MNKRLYYILITIAFGVVSIPTVLSMILKEAILINYIDKALIKTILIFFIGIVEASYILRTLPKILGWVFLFILFIGIQFRIMHWPWGKELIIGAGLAVLTNLTVLAIAEKNKGLINYLLFVFVLERIAIILLPPNELLWWVDVIICFAITLVGIRYLFNSKIELGIEASNK